MTVLKFILCQGAAFGVVSLMLAPLAEKFDTPVPLIAWLPVTGAIAAIAGWRVGLVKGWAVAQFGFPFAVAGALWLGLPGYVWLGLFVLTLMVYWNSFRGGVPLYLSNQTTWSALAGLLPDKPAVRFVDLGGGIGGTALFLAAGRPDGEFVSVESAPIPYAISWLRKIISGRSNVRVVYGTFWKQSLAPFDVVYAFLSPRPMPDLYLKARAEMHQGALFISNSFAVPGQTADDIIELDDRRRTRLHIWKVN